MQAGLASLPRFPAPLRLRQSEAHGPCAAWDLRRSATVRAPGHRASPKGASQSGGPGNGGLSSRSADPLQDSGTGPGGERLGLKSGPAIGCPWLDRVLPQPAMTAVPFVRRLGVGGLPRPAIPGGKSARGNPGGRLGRPGWRRQARPFSRAWKYDRKAWPGHATEKAVVLGRRQPSSRGSSALHSPDRPAPTAPGGRPSRFCRKGAAAGRPQAGNSEEGPSGARNERHGASVRNGRHWPGAMCWNRSQQGGLESRQKVEDPRNGHGQGQAAARLASASRCWPARDRSARAARAGSRRSSSRHRRRSCSAGSVSGWRSGRDARHCRLPQWHGVTARAGECHGLPLAPGLWRPVGHCSWCRCRRDQRRQRPPARGRAKERAATAGSEIPGGAPDHQPGRESRQWRSHQPCAAGLAQPASGGRKPLPSAKNPAE